MFDVMSFSTFGSHGKTRNSSNN